MLEAFFKTAREHPCPRGNEAGPCRREAARARGSCRGPAGSAGASRRATGSSLLGRSISGEVAFSLLLGGMGPAAQGAGNFSFWVRSLRSTFAACGVHGGGRWEPAGPICPCRFSASLPSFHPVLCPHFGQRLVPLGLGCARSPLFLTHVALCLAFPASPLLSQLLLLHSLNILVCCDSGYRYLPVCLKMRFVFFSFFLVLGWLLRKGWS